MNVKGDISGGLIAGIVALPLALAFGIASGLGASAGLWGAITLGLAAALLGGTKMQISGPTGPMSVVTASVVFSFAGDIGSVMAVFVLAGLMQILFGICKLGKFVNFIPYSVVSGFMSGVGVIIVLLQLNPVLGANAVGNTIQAIKTLPGSLSGLNLTALALALATVAILYLTPKRLAALIPTPLLALLTLTPVSAALNLNVPVIGAIPTGLPELNLPTPDAAKLGSIAMYAFMLALLGSIDSLLTSLVADSITKTKHNSNQELIGQGVGNALTGFVSGIPGAGATMRTVANIKAGGTGRISGAAHALFLLLVALIFAPVVAYVPLCVLAGILIKVGIDILDYRLLRRLTHIPQKDLAIMTAVFILTVLVDLIFAVAVGVAFAWALYAFGVSKPNKKFDINVLNEETARVVRIKGPMFFGTNVRIMQNLSAHGSPNHLKIDCSKVTFMDISSVYALQDFIDGVDESATKVSIVIDDRSFSGRALNEFRYLLGRNIELQDERQSGIGHVRYTLNAATGGLLVRWTYMAGGNVTAGGGLATRIGEGTGFSGEYQVERVIDNSGERSYLTLFIEFDGEQAKLEWKDGMSVKFRGVGSVDDGVLTAGWREA